MFVHNYFNVNQRGETSYMKSLLQICLWTLCCAFTLLFIACPEEPSGQYTCANGTPQSGVPDGGGDVARCIACDSGYGLSAADATCQPTTYTCANGEPAIGDPDIPNTQQCASCDDGFTLNATTMLCDGDSYTCANGTPLDGTPPNDGDAACQACIGGYVLEQMACRQARFTCYNGTSDNSDTPDNSVTADVERCDICDDGYYKESNRCLANIYTCANGTAEDEGTPGAMNGDQFCASCATGYALISTDASCVTDTDNDGTPDSTDTDDDNDGSLDSADVDDDNDGLIEIHNLDMLHNIRWNLAGTTYDDEEADTSTGDTGDTTGAPIRTAAHCNTATDGVFLCGYELTRDLDFADADSYASGSINMDWRPDMANNEGWPGIGIGIDSSNSFNARFEGNGYAIANLYRRDSGQIGLFNAAGTDAYIRAVGVVDAVLYGNGSATNRVGALAGINQGIIIASYATATVSSENNSQLAFESLGNLVGQNEGTIIASYASGTVNGGDSADQLGGLVGSGDGIIIASYAAATVNGGNNGDSVGGLIGYNGLVINTNTSAIIASYATGTVNGDNNDGNDNDQVGGLTGINQHNITASYATATVDGGGDSDIGGALIGRNTTTGTTTVSYGFGSVMNAETVTVEKRPTGFDETTTARTLQITDPSNAATYAGSQWNNADDSTMNAWDFGDEMDTPALRYADYDGTDNVYDCDMFPPTIPGTNMPIVCNVTLLPGQR